MHNPLTTLIYLVSGLSSRTFGLRLLPSHHLTTQPSFLPIDHQQFRHPVELNSILKVQIHEGFFKSALSQFSAFMADGARPDHFTLPLVIKAISTLPRPDELGKAIHCLGNHLGFSGDVYFCNSLIDFYVKCKDNISAHIMFDEMHEKDVVSWTTLISGYIQSGDISESFNLFHNMRISGIEPNSVTLAVILRTFEVEKSVNRGKQMHGFAIKIGFWNHGLVQNSFLTAYSKMECINDAEKLFASIEKRSFVSWNIMLMAYFSNGDLCKLLKCFQRMMNETYPTPETLTLIISALSKCSELRLGQQIHSYAVKQGNIDIVLQSTFMNLYVQCGDLASSFSLFQEASTNNCSNLGIVMMWAFIQSGQFRQCISLFQRMRNFGFEPNANVLRCLATACGHLGALRIGKLIHGYLIRHQLIAELEGERVETSILNMYSKCGNIIISRRCFDSMVYKDIVAWSSMIESYSIHGMGLDAIKLFHQMQEAGLSPNSITFLSLLSSCSHSGLVNEGCQIFSYMSEYFGIKVELSHYTCMVDLLGRAGMIAEALDLIHSMDVEPDGRIWGALLASCRVYRNINVGDYAAQRLLELEPDNVGYHIILSKIQSGGDQWDKAERIWKSMDELELKGRPGCSCIEEEDFSLFSCC